MRSAGRSDGALDLGRAALLDVGEHVRALVRHHSLECRARFDTLAADHHRDVDALCGHRRKPRLQLRTLGRARGVALDRLVDGGGRTEDAGGAHSGDCILDRVRVTRHPYDVPGWGIGEVWVRDGIVIQHELASESLLHEPDAGPAQPPAPPPPSPDGGAGRPARTLPGKRARDRADFVPELCRRFAAHLAGVPTSYADIPLELDWATPLQHELAAAARAIPWGEVVSYGDLAALAGRPGAARAAGSFCADNRYPLIIPCHRVVAANGIGGYGAAGPGLKRRLLAVEGMHL